MKRIYADTAAGMSNPSSIHEEGMRAKKALEDARAKVAELIGAHPNEIIFTSGGTEGNNLAIFGCATLSVAHKEIITTSIEHASVLEPAKKLGAAIISVGESGIVDSEEIKKNLNSETKLVSIIYANNEIGTIQPIREIARVIRNFRKTRNSELGTGNFPLFHIDACQAPRFLDLNVARLGVDLMTLNGSKIYGPKGSGCLYVRRGIKLTPLFWGGGQERGLRSGTENVPAIIGFAEALALCAKLREKESAQLTKLRDELVAGLLKIEGVKLNGHATQRLPNNVNVNLPILEPEQWVLELDAKGIACSAGSACSSNKQNDDYDIIGVRFSLGRETTKAEINYIIKTVFLILKKYVRNSLS